MYTSQKSSIHTPLQNYASIPFKHIEQKQRHTYIKRDITKERPNGQKLNKTKINSGSERCHKMAMNKSQLVCLYPQGNQPGRQASRQTRSTTHQS